MEDFGKLDLSSLEDLYDQVYQELEEKDRQLSNMLASATRAYKKSWNDWNAFNNNPPFWLEKVRLKKVLKAPERAVNAYCEWLGWYGPQNDDYRLNDDRLKSKYEEFKQTYAYEELSKERLTRLSFWNGFQPGADEAKDNQVDSDNENDSSQLQKEIKTPTEDEIRSQLEKEIDEKTKYLSEAQVAYNFNASNIVTLKDREFGIFPNGIKLSMKPQARCSLIYNLNSEYEKFKQTPAYQKLQKEFEEKYKEEMIEEP